MNRTIALLALLLALACFYEADGATIPTRYDAQIQSAVRRFWPDYRDWKAGKAQLYAESRLDPAARSSVGAEGVAQFMTPTFLEITRAMGYGLVSPNLTEYAIPAYAYYMAKLRAQWRSPRPVEDREDLARSSYNAGLGNLLAAQRMCNQAVLFAEIAACLPGVTGALNAAQTATYIKHIRIYRSWLQ